MWEPQTYHCVDHSDLVVKLYFVVCSAKQRNLLTIMYEELNILKHFKMLIDIYCLKRDTWKCRILNFFGVLISWLLYVILYLGYRWFWFPFPPLPCMNWWQTQSTQRRHNLWLWKEVEHENITPSSRISVFTTPGYLIRYFLFNS